MFEDSVELELISPEKKLMNETSYMVVVPATAGDLAVLPRRAPIVTHLRPGVLALYDKDYNVLDRILIYGGFADVNHDKCTVYTEAAIPVSEIDRGSVALNLKERRIQLKEAKSEAAQIEIQHHIAFEEAILATLEQDERLKKRNKGVKST